MKFLVDANLPFKVQIALKKLGYDTLHTDNLPNKEFTTDEEIRIFAKKQNRIIVTKDTDFLESHLLRNNPEFLLLITTGNISNKNLLKLISEKIEEINQLFEEYRLIELSPKGIVVYEK